MLKKCHGNHPNMKKWNELLFQTVCEPRFLITFMLISFCSLKALLIQKKYIPIILHEKKKKKPDWKGPKKLVQGYFSQFSYATFDLDH